MDAVARTVQGGEERMRDFTEVRKQIERLIRTIGEHPTYEEQLAYFVNALSISSFLLGILEGEDMAQEWGESK